MTTATILRRDAEANAGGVQGTHPAGHTTSCGCGAIGEAIAVDLPDQDGMVLFGDRPARRVFCIPCLAAELDDDTSPWVEVHQIITGGGRPLDAMLEVS